MLAILLAHAVAALLAPACVRVLGRNAFLVLAAVPAASLGWVVANWGRDRNVHVDWVPAIGMDVDLRFDALAAIMSALVLGIGALVLAYCARYFTSDEPRLGVFAAEMVAFAGAMFGLVVSDNALLLYVFWEITSVLSFLLVAHKAERAAARRAATMALLVTTAGGLAMLAGIVIMGITAQTYQLSHLIAHPPTGLLTDIAVVLILIGALSKSAVVPLHFWLPGAMAAPTPVSAYLHAAAMVKAGVYLVARLAPAFADAPPWRGMVLGLGLASMLLAGYRALRVTDLKLILAFGTVSQLGFLMVLVGIGSHDAALAGMAMLVAHALFKAALFLTAGVVEHATGTRDIRKLAGLARRAPHLAVIAALAAASMAALPPLLGFVGKESAFATLLEPGTPIPQADRMALLAGVVAGSALTVAYSARFLWGAFADKNFRNVEGVLVPSKAVKRYRAPGLLLTAVPGLLAAAGLAAGACAQWTGSRLEPYARTLPGGQLHLALWHGAGWPPALTALVIAGGGAIFALRRHFEDIPYRPLLGNADRGYDAAVRALDRLSTWLTGSIQRGSLPLNQAILLVTFVLLPMASLLVWGAQNWPDAAVFRWDSPLEPTLGVIMVAAAIGATVMRNRLASVLLIGITGYGCGLIFALYGAPDLALTQLLVETLTLVIFVLVLRKMPAEIDDAGAAGLKLPRALLGLAVGATVAGLGGVAMSSRSAGSISRLMPVAAHDDAHGGNVVNVLLVDIRGWDTLGETAVLVVAATGVASLMFRHRRFGSAPRVADAPTQPDIPAVPDQVNWLPAGHLLHPRHRSMVLEVTTRLVFPTIMVLSVYFFFSGHNAPGGGFAGGLTAGLGLVLRYLAGGRYELGEAAPVDAGQVLGIGLLCTIGTAVGSLLLGAPPLSSAVLTAHLPVLGAIHFNTAMVFDLGVYLIVVGLVLDVLRSLGARLDSIAERGGLLSGELPIVARPTAEASG
ncbi:MAG: Na+/H+ antiporter subunit A [Mycobacteriaceae bacterium]|nr:Na+/H+ antiporter subunit A [Mycobacteriaceae bacterium]